MLADNTLRCWGYAGFGLIAQGAIEPAEQATPLTVPIGAVSSFSSRGAHACAVVAADKTLRCWGFNGTGELANQNAADACGYFAPCKSSPQMTTFPATGGIIERVYTGVATSYARVEAAPSMRGEPTPTRGSVMCQGHRTISRAAGADTDGATRIRSR